MLKITIFSFKSIVFVIKNENCFILLLNQVILETKKSKLEFLFELERNMVYFREILGQLFLSIQDW